jgi:hypothetical protein
MDKTINHLDRIYAEFTRGSQGFCSEVSTWCGFDISRAEIARIAERAETPAQFQAIWADEDWWTDANNGGAQ